MKYVESYIVEHFDSGIIHLMFNTTGRYMTFHRSNDHTYHIGYNPDDPDDESFKNFKECLCEIPVDILGLKKDIYYLSTEIQNKDQISFFYIPFQLIDKTKKIFESVHQNSSIDL